MNDLDICQKIAAIEGQRVWVHEGKCYSVPPCSVGFRRGQHEYNPLTDDALCFQLMVKYGVELTPMFSGCWCATVAKVYTFDEQIDYKSCPTWLDESPNKAICLAIIEANKG